MKKTKQTVALIVGAGPAGLTAAYELLRRTDVHPIVCEKTDAIGGISQTVEYHGNRMDIGGHRFFSKSEEVMNWWQQVMPLQAKPAKDDILLGETEKEFARKGPDPEKEDRTMLLRRRVSRIFFLRKFFDYPISMKKETFLNMGFVRMMRAGFGYLWACVHKLPETSLENFYINRFGRPLYEMFFEDYTTKVWGVHPSQLGADWGSQRVKGLSVLAVLRDMWRKNFGRKNNAEVETSLIEQFIYPKYGPGQLWEIVADDIRKQGGEIRMKTAVTGVEIKDNRVVSVEVTDAKGQTEKIQCDYFVSSMPIKDLVAALQGVKVPKEVQKIARELPYRDFITVGLLVDRMKIKNETKLKTYANRVPDTWIYIQERDVRIGRLQIFNNWSPYLVKDYEHTMWIGLEYFCSEGDELWTMAPDRFIAMAKDELARIDIIEPDAVLDACHVRIQKAYPAYYGSYYQLDQVKTYLDGIANLFCIGRNGQHRYNNMDHSMMTAFQLVSAIAEGRTEDKTAIWNVNTETEYHESK
jgi:protoporphyrinogen oxidase